MGLDLGKTWAGFATQSKLFAEKVGMTEWKGTMARLDDPSRYICTFDANAIQFGGGYAAGQSGHVIFFFNVARPAGVEGKSFGNGMDTTLAIPGSKLVGLALHAEKAIKLGLAIWDLGSMQELARDAYKGVTTKNPSVVAIPIPGLDGIVGVSRSEGFGCTINIRRLMTPNEIHEDA
jgi:hypothetical protein